MVRLGARWLLKRRGRNDVTIEQTRRRAATVERLVPKPAAGTRTLALYAGGVRADRVSTPLSECCRHVFFLHGGGFIVGSPALYRHFTWRIASAARVSGFGTWWSGSSSVEFGSARLRQSLGPRSVERAIKRL
jgi:hypothetical protein